jgi:hypothetical protein
VSYPVQPSATHNKEATRAPSLVADDVITSVGLHVQTRISLLDSFPRRLWEAAHAVARCPRNGQLFAADMSVPRSIAH